ncbi:hypothetical protein KUTeg_007919 [Tegillarca granosa]|uniref:Ectonucleotide pyrophosphatase/phosphodiesterase family member 5 n=1 Tax=Tegillarca granosa TaxID=220873 RepID=A0ABQ9FEP8_TEGGR|nr:hypothetical protein KUTeg_007919 [Tegillarca granosa]
MIWNIAAVFYVYTSLIAVCYCRLPIPHVLLISFDGFRWDYLQKVQTPNFDRIMRSGVFAKHGIKNIFTTKTFPNHHSIATGLYAENHGIVGDVFYDPEFIEIFNGYDKRKAMDSKWYINGGEPIWVTNQKNNIERRSGCLFWPLCGPSINDVTPFRHMFYDPDMPNRTQIDTLVKWFTDNPPINLGLLYFDEPDVSGHRYGPDSKEIKIVIQHLDDMIGYVLDQLQQKGLLDTMHIIVTSDHGMSTLVA